ncbi:uncharacterized protein IAS62_004011 [Cryptococcus decagattii]|uniref:Uncharacterized protein n=1 Tax=Cryptococcus decagattii TaxID=1859122 RepID=A0ABZ2B1R3_9TREE
MEKLEHLAFKPGFETERLMPVNENLPKDIDISRLASTDLLQQHLGRLSTFRPSPALALSFNQVIFAFQILPLSFRYAHC